MTKEIIDKDTPHADIGKQKFRVRKNYTAWVEYDVVADSKDDAESIVMEHCGIEKIEWSEGYHKDHPVEVYSNDYNLDYSGDTDMTTKIAECIPYEDSSTVDYSDPDWSTNDLEWNQTSSGDSNKIADKEEDESEEVPMSERCIQAEVVKIFKDKEEGTYDTLTYILEGGFKGFHNMDSSELIEEYKQIEEQWYNLYECSELPFTPYEEDPIHKLEEEKI